MENFISKAKRRLNKLQKQLHPLEIRKNIMYKSARASKHVHIGPKLEEYINRLIAKGESVADLYEMKGLEAGERAYLQVPLSEARFLEVFVKALGAKNVLEIGTFCGFSTAFLARALPEGGVVLTCDEDRRYVQIAEKFWNHLGVQDKIHFELGEAKAVLHKLVEDKPSQEFFDVIFIDADKENYKKYAELSFNLLRKGGTLIMDNTLWKGLVQHEDSRDNSAEHVRTLNDWVFGTFGSNAAILPAWDGVTVIVKNDKK